MNGFNTYQRTKNLSFGENPICSINLKKKQKDSSYKFIPAHFSQLDPIDDKDEMLIKRINEVWNRKKVSYAEDIANNFAAQNGRSVNSNFYIIAKDSAIDDLYKKTTCVLQTTSTDEKNKSRFCIDYLQAHPNIAKKSSTIKGSGELAIYGCVKEAQKNGFQKVYICSTNNPFYEHLELKNGTTKNSFIIDETEYDDFIKRVEKKYDIK